jgi:hypothetical protein
MSETTSKTEAGKLDNCQVCRGQSGGVKGNENVIDGVVVCDYCSFTITRFRALNAADSSRELRAMSDPIGEIEKRIAYLQDCLTCSKCPDEPTECAACSHYRQELELQEKSLTRLRELESGVTVSRECAESLINDAESIRSIMQIGGFLKADQDPYLDELRTALSRQEGEK